MDDPLSAVDARVGRHIFEQCICGLLRDTTRILVTHQIQFLPAVDQILLLSPTGAVDGLGTYAQLVASGHLKEAAVHPDEDDDVQNVKDDKTDVLQNRRESDGSLFAAEQRQTGVVKWFVLRWLRGISACTGRRTGSTGWRSADTGRLCM